MKKITIKQTVHVNRLYELISEADKEATALLDSMRVEDESDIYLCVEAADIAGSMARMVAKLNQFQSDANPNQEWTEKVIKKYGT